MPIGTPFGITRYRWEQLQKMLNVDSYQIKTQSGSTGDRNVCELLDKDGNVLYSGSGGLEHEAFWSAIEAAKNDL